MSIYHFRTMRGQTLKVWLEGDSTLFDIHEAVRRVYVEEVAPLKADEFVVIIVRGQRLCSLEEAAAADYAIRAGGLAPAFPDGEERAAAIMAELPKLACVHVVVNRRPAPEA